MLFLPAASVCRYPPDQHETRMSNPDFAAAQESGLYPPPSYGWMSDDARRALVQAQLDIGSTQPWIKREASRMMLRKRIDSEAAVERSC